jgi:hypothetical protein
MSEDWPCTAEQISDLRDVQGLSWRAIADKLGLGQDKKAPARFARLAYRDLTGRHWTDSKPSAGSPRSNGALKPPQASTKRSSAPSRANSVQWDDDTDQDEIERALMGEEIVKADGRVQWKPKRLLVLRDWLEPPYKEEILCRYVTAFSYGPDGTQPLQVEIVEHLQAKDWVGTQIRTLFVHKIMRVT